MTEQFSFERVDHVQLAIPAGGEDEGRAFWGDLLGLSELPKPPSLAARGGCWFDGPGFQVHLVKALSARLLAAGYLTTWSDDVPGQDRFHTNDPFGNRLEFLEPR
jgi:hypothetical protein